jgi:hypothetical protein
LRPFRARQGKARLSFLVLRGREVLTAPPWREPAVFKPQNDAQSEQERNHQIEKPEDDEGGQHVRGGNVRHAFQDDQFEYPESARRVTQKRGRKRSQEHAEDDQETRIYRVGKREIDDSRGAEQFERSGGEPAA